MNQYTTQYNEKGELKIMKGDQEMKFVPSLYMPTEEERKVIGMVRDDFTDSYVSMYKPRREFNDISLINRIDRDQMAWNTYQVNDGDGYEEDISDSWKSRAMRPIIRNKSVSIAAHATARLIFPKVFAYNEQSDEQRDAAQVMRDLIEWSADQSNYQQTALFAIISALVNPIAYTYTEYCEVYKRIKSEKDENGKWQWEEVLDEERSGFKDVIVPPDQLFIENFYEYNIQNQGFLIWRRVQSYDLMAQRYGHLENFKYVQKGVRVFYNDANDTFYDIYDDEIEDRLCEEILYWKKPDLFLKIVNGVLLCEHDNPNPRKDKLYPFAKTGYELIDEGKFFYYKSLAFKLKQDADILNTLYPMFIDGTYLSLMPPIINSGDANIDNSVIVPGVMTSLGEGNNPTPIQIKSDLNAGLVGLREVERGIDDSSQSELKTPTEKGVPTAYEMALRERERQTRLGLFIDMIGDWVNQYNKLRMGDIIQYLTIAEVDKILDNAPLVYKNFLLPERQTDAGKKTRKIDFDAEIPEKMTDKEYLKESYKLLDEGGEDVEIYKVNPILFRNLKYQLKVSPDVMNPISEELERAYGIEGFDRAILAAKAGVRVDLEKSYKDFILHYNPQSRNNPDEYILEEEAVNQENILDVLGTKKVGDGMTSPSERALKATPPVSVGV